MMSEPFGDPFDGLLLAVPLGLTGFDGLDADDVKQVNRRCAIVQGFLGSGS